MYTMKDFSRKMTSEPDQTIEILMSELDQEIMQIFHRENSSTAQEAREVSMSMLASYRSRIGFTYRDQALISWYQI